MISRLLKRICQSGVLIQQHSIFHQSVEKLLKGLISVSERSIPRTHDLERLGDLLECPDDIMPDLIDLMGDYQTSRYPDMSELIPCEYYTEAIAKDRVRKTQ